MLTAEKTKGLSLEEIGALFDDEIALDISHLSEEQRQDLDARIAASDSTGIARMNLEKSAVAREAEDVSDVEKQS